MGKISNPVLVDDLGQSYPTAKSLQMARYGMYRCGCGNLFRAQVYNVNKGNTQSCGCYDRAKFQERITEHYL